jgi:hypothetical protein
MPGCALRLFDANRPLPPDEPQPFARVPDSAVGDTRLSDGAFRLLAAIMSGVWSQASEIHLTREELTRRVGKGLTTVKRQLVELEECGYLERDRDYTKPGAPHRLILGFRLRAPSGTGACMQPAKSGPLQPAESGPLQPAKSGPLQPAKSGPPRGQDRADDGPTLDGCNRPKLDPSSYRENFEEKGRERNPLRTPASSSRPGSRAATPPAPDRRPETGTPGAGGDPGLDVPTAAEVEQWVRDAQQASGWGELCRRYLRDWVRAGVVPRSVLDQLPTEKLGGGSGLREMGSPRAQKQPPGGALSTDPPRAV